MFTKRRLVAVLFGALQAFICLAANAHGQRNLLGTRDVTGRVDHDRITVTSLRGDFKRIKFKVAKRAIEFYRVVVRFGNGTSQRLAFRQLIPAGGESRWVDLRGTDRVIRSIDFWYDAKSLFGQGARIWVFGGR
ncbi:MAG TPA: DUF2541 family protein [Pyrinomonadaceae bacterium]|nr:DUF2541 family protein [Pyrinomonadaceae bacterium]